MQGLGSMQGLDRIKGLDGMEAVSGTAWASAAHKRQCLSIGFHGGRFGIQADFRIIRANGSCAFYSSRPIGARLASQARSHALQGSDA